MDLNDLCNQENPNLVDVLVRIQALVETFILFKKGTEYDEEAENVAIDAALHMVLNLKAHEKFILPYQFWFGYIQKNSMATWNKYYLKQDRVAVTETLTILRDADPYTVPTVKNHRNFCAFTIKRHKELVRTNVLDAILTLAKEVDPRLSIYLRKKAKKEINNFSTRELLAIYKRYTATSVKEFKRCKKTLNAMFHKERPSQRVKSMKQE